MIQLKLRDTSYREHGGNKGFTLVELVVVMIILSILAALTTFGINAWQDFAFYRSVNSTAEVMFVDAQNELTSLSVGGGLKNIEDRITQAVAMGDAGAGELNYTGLTSVNGTGYPSLDVIFPERVGKTDDPNKYSEQIYYIRADKGDYKKYLANPSDPSLSEGAKLVFEILSPTVKDTEVLNGAICIEFTALDGQVFGVSYSDRVGGFSYDDKALNDASRVSIVDRQEDYRMDNLIGFYGAETLARAPKGRDLDEIKWIEIHNEEQLYLAFDGEDLDNRDYLLTIYDNESPGTKLFDIVLEGSKLKTLANTTAPIGCTVRRYNADATSTDMGMVDFMAWYEIDAFTSENTVKLVLDGADISATTDEYLSYLDKCGSDYSNFADSSTYSTSGISSEPYILTQSFTRFGFPLDTRLYAEATLDGASSAKVASTLDITDPAKIEYKNAVAGFNNDTPANKGTGEYTYKISNARHLYNIRYVELVNSCLKNDGGKMVVDENTYAHYKGRPDGGTNTFELEEDIDWKDFVTTKGALYDSRKMLDPTNIEYADGTRIIRTNAPFVSFEKLYATDTFNGNGKHLNNFSIKQVLDDAVLKNGDHTNTYLKEYNERTTGSIDATTGSQVGYSKYKTETGFKKVYPAGLFSENYGKIKDLILDGIVVESERISVNVGGTTEEKDGDIAGSFCGINYGTLDNLKVYNNLDASLRTSSVTGENYVGGIFGATPITYTKLNNGTYIPSNDLVKSTDIKLNKLENHAMVYAYKYGGGIAGYIKNDERTSNAMHKFSIEGCVSTRIARPRKKLDTATNKKLYTGDFLGGIVGYMECVSDDPADLMVKNCYVAPLMPTQDQTKANNEKDTVKEPEDREVLVGNFVGGFVGGNEGGLISGCTINSSRATKFASINPIKYSADEKNNTKNNVVGGDYVGAFAGALLTRKTTDNTDKVIVYTQNNSVRAGVIGNTSDDTKSKCEVNAISLFGMNYVGGVVGMADVGSSIDYAKVNTNINISASEYSAGGLAGTCFSLQTLNSFDKDHHNSIAPATVFARAIAGGYFGTVFVGDNDPSVNPNDASIIRGKSTGIYNDGSNPADTYPYLRPIDDSETNTVGYPMDAYIVKVSSLSNPTTTLNVPVAGGGFAGYMEVFAQDKGKYSEEYTRSFRDEMIRVHKTETRNEAKRTAKVELNNTRYYNLTTDFLFARRVNEADPSDIINAPSAKRGILIDGEDSGKNTDGLVPEIFVKRVATQFLAGGMFGTTERYSPIYIEDLFVTENSGNRMLGPGRNNNEPRLETKGASTENPKEVAPTGIPDIYLVSRNDIKFSYFGAVAGRVNEGMIVRHSKGLCTEVGLSGWMRGGICAVNAGRIENSIASSFTCKNNTNTDPYNNLLSHCGGICAYNGGPDESHPAVVINCLFEDNMRLFGRRSVGGMVEENGAFGIVELNRYEYKADILVGEDWDGVGAGMICGNNAGQIVINVPYTPGAFSTDELKIDGSILSTKVSATNSRNNGFGGLIGKNKCSPYGFKGLHTGVVVRKSDIPICNYAEIEIKASNEHTNTMGGIIGEVTGPFELSGCRNYGKITSTGNVGGIIGMRRAYSTDTKSGYVENQGASNRLILTDCVNYGELKGEYICGGIIGVLDYHKPNTPGTTELGNAGESGTDQIITDVYNHGVVHGQKYTGGIVGVITDVDEANPTYICNVRIENAVNTGTITGEWDGKEPSHVGGIVGLIGTKRTSAFSPKLINRFYYCRNYGVLACDNEDINAPQDKHDIVFDATEMKYCFAVDPGLQGDENLNKAKDNNGYTYMTEAHFGGVVSDDPYSVTSSDGTAVLYTCEDTMRYNFFVGEKCADSEVLSGSVSESTSSGGGLITEEADENVATEAAPEEAIEVTPETSLDGDTSVSENNVPSTANTSTTQTANRAPATASTPAADTNAAPGTDNEDILSTEDVTPATLQTLCDSRLTPEANDANKSLNNLYRFYVDLSEPDGEGNKSFILALFGYKTNILLSSVDSIPDQQPTLDMLFANYDTLGAAGDTSDAFLNAIFTYIGLIK